MSTEGRVNTHPCPACGCWLAAEFKCGCGQIHDDYCVNCGRFVSLKPTESLELMILKDPCKAGPVLHEHKPLSDAEAKRRWDAQIVAGKRASQ